MSSARPYDHSEDFKTIEAWWLERGLTAPTSGQLPVIGYIVEGVCAGFLYQTDSTVSLLDGFISSKESTHEERAQGLQTITDALCTEAKLLGFSVVYAFTQLPEIVNLGVRNQFKEVPMKYFHMLRRI